MNKKYYEAYDERYRVVHEKSLCWFEDEPSKIIADVISGFGIDKTMNILEIGCGEGRDAKTLLKKDYKVLATDISSEAIEYCKRKYPEYKAHFKELDCINGELDEHFDFIYAVAVVHMLVLDEDRTAFYKFIHNHLKPNSIALICTMGNGIDERSSDINTAFDLMERTCGDETVLVAGTSCRVVNFNTFEKELQANNFEICDIGLTSIDTISSEMMFAVVKNRQSLENNL